MCLAARTRRRGSSGQSHCSRGIDRDRAFTRSARHVRVDRTAAVGAACRRRGREPCGPHARRAQLTQAQRSVAQFVVASQSITPAEVARLSLSAWRRTRRCGRSRSSRRSPSRPPARSYAACSSSASERRRSLDSHHPRVAALKVCTQALPDRFDGARQFAVAQGLLVKLPCCPRMSGERRGRLPRSGRYRIHPVSHEPGQPTSMAARRARPRVPHPHARGAACGH